MKKFIVSILLFLIAILSLSSIAEAYVRVRGYFRRDGTYIMPHYRTYPNRIKWDNWSSSGNYNPFTGKRGYKRW
ncbi:MAG: hypothetical protein KatS3mg095_0005 [Candidatus Parcubacteria bacterium]|nr:MAG: hypothetical protein KatS3mg095_0005 [Candidatus Parcubacteria bacterium]